MHVLKNIRFQLIYRTIVGVVSNNRDIFCASDMTPSMYTDVVYYLNWIRTNTKYLESGNAKCYKKERLSSSDPHAGTSQHKYGRLPSTISKNGVKIHFS